LGGEAAVRAIVHTFVGRVVDDIMIGFMFAGVHRARLELLEYQHAAVFLDGPEVYRGRPLDKAHARFRIAGGQFARRRQILAETLQLHGVPEPLMHAWLAHQDSLRPLITQDGDGVCHGRRPGDA
jgi:hemoglobin